jgi:geranylgeranylglycerol-phosphate geranylgeranyltransferase
MAARLLPVLQILRPHNMLAATLGVCAGYYAAGGRDAGVVAVPALLTALATGAGNVINDYFDVAIDRVNKPSRPLPSGRVSRAAAKRIYLAASVATTAGALLALERELAALVIAWQAALFAYASVLKRVLGAGNLLVASVSASAFFAGALAAGEARAAAIPCAIAFAFVMCRELVKGGEDLEGDAAAGVRTLAVAVGRERAARVAAASMLAVAVWIPAPVVAGVYAPAYLFVMALWVEPSLVVGALAIARSPRKTTFAGVSRALKLSMFAGIAAIVLGS